MDIRPEGLQTKCKYLFTEINSMYTEVIPDIRIEWFLKLKLDMIRNCKLSATNLTFESVHQGIFNECH